MRRHPFYRYARPRTAGARSVQYGPMMRRLEAPHERVISQLQHLRTYRPYPSPELGPRPDGILGVRDFLLQLSPWSTLQAGLIAVEMLMEYEAPGTVGEAQDAAKRRHDVYALAATVRRLVNAGPMAVMDHAPLGDLASRLCADFASWTSGNVTHIEVALEGITDGLLGFNDTWNFGALQAVAIAAIAHAPLDARFDTQGGEDLLGDVVINFDSLMVLSRSVSRVLHHGDDDMSMAPYAAAFRDNGFIGRWYDRVRSRLALATVLHAQGVPFELPQKTDLGVQLAPGLFDKRELDDTVTLDNMAGWVGESEWEDPELWHDDYFWQLEQEALAQAQEEGIQDPQAYAEAKRFEAQDQAGADYFRAWRGKVEPRADELLARIELDAYPLYGENSWDFRIRPKQTWWDSLAPLIELINGVGYFHFHTELEFLESGPYTPRRAVLEHLGYLRQYREVYGI